jgi:hypothetical protein
MIYTVVAITFLSVFLAIVGYIFRETLSFARLQIPHTEQTSSEKLDTQIIDDSLLSTG